MSESGQGNKKIDEMTRKLRRLDRRLTERWDKEWIHYFKESNPFVYFIHHEELETMTSLKGKTAREVYQTKWQSQAQFGPLGELNIWAEEEQLAGKKLLEIGCGPGFLGKQLGKIAGSYIGIDYSQLALSIARRVSPPNCLYLPISDLDKIFEHAGTVDMMVTRHFFIHNNYHNAMSVLNLAYALLKPLGTVSADFYMPNPARNPQPVRYPSKHELDPDFGF